MLIEFVGVPGVGKTTVARQLVTTLRESGRTARLVGLTGYHDDAGRRLSRRAVAVDRLLGVAHRPAITAEMVRCWRAEGTGLALSWMINLGRRNRATRRYLRSDDVIVLDEGALSALCLASAARSGAWDFSQLLASIHQAPVVVSLHAAPEVAAERVIQRRGILSDRSPADLLQLQERYVDAQAVVEERSASAVLRYDTDAETAPALAHRILRDVERVIELRRSPD